MSALLEFRRLAKAYFGVPAVENLSLAVEEGTTLGLIGENGAGKSTLMNMIGGIVAPTSGEMLWRGTAYAPHDAAEATAAGIAFIHQELNLFTNLSVAENLYIDGFPRRFGFIDRRAIAERARSILGRLELDVAPDAIVADLSPGERQLVEIAKALHNEADLIIFDEPTTSLTPRETARLFETIERLRAEGRTIIYISHILGDVARLSDRVAILRDGRLVDEGAIADFGIPRMISAMIGRELASMYPPRTGSPGDDPVLSAASLGQPGVLHDVSFEIRAGEILGLFGLMGSGRSELARILFGLDPHETGRIEIMGRSPAAGTSGRIRDGLAFVTENRREEGLMMEASIAANLSLVSIRDFGRTPAALIDAAELRTRTEDLKDDLAIKATDIARQPAKALSGGNQQKVVIGKWLMTAPRLFILDEPTRGVDVGAKYEIYALADRIAAAGNAILFISSEIEELLGMADRIMVMSRGEITGAFDRAGFDRARILRAAFRENAA